MLAARPSSGSPFSSFHPSPLTLSVALGERRAATQNQAVPASPSLSPLALQVRQRRGSTNSLNGGVMAAESNGVAANGQSPSPAVVPVFSGSPLLRQILKVGRKRQRESSPDALPGGAPSNTRQTTPSPIATNTKRFCRHCSNVYDQSGGNMVVLSRTKTRTAALNMEQVVPDSVQEIGATGGMKVNYATNQDGVKLFELFTGDDIFAHHEE